jgi:hypothetical protein
MKRVMPVALFTLLLSTPSFVNAQALGVVVEAGAEDFEWTEHGSNGNRLLKESGTRYRIAGRYEKEHPKGWLYGAGAQVYFGTVDYDGQTQSGTPAKTKIDYSGLRAEGRGGYVWNFGGNGIGGLGMLGFDTWDRHIQDGQTSSGQAVYGYDEFYFMTYLIVGPVYQYTGATWHTRLHAAAKRPLFVSEDVPDFDVTLYPKPTTTLFVSWENRWKVSPRVSVGAGLYYETLKFNASDVEQSSIGQVYQPESKSSTKGLRVQVGF